MRAKLQRAERLLARGEGIALVALLAVMVTLAFAQVVLRHFGAGLLWGETLLKQLVMWTGFLGAALAAESEKHFAWEAANLGTPPSWKTPVCGQVPLMLSSTASRPTNSSRPEVSTTSGARYGLARSAALCSAVWSAWVNASAARRRFSFESITNPLLQFLSDRGLPRFWISARGVARLQQP